MDNSAFSSTSSNPSSISSSNSSSSFSTVDGAGAGASADNASLLLLPVPAFDSSSHHLLVGTPPMVLAGPDNDNDNDNINSNWESQDVQYLNETLDMNDSEESSQEGGSCISSQPIIQEKDNYCDVYSKISCSCISTDILNGAHTTTPFCHCDNQNLNGSNFHLTR